MRLSEELVDRVVARHASPIADAVVALVASESVHERRDRVVETFRVIVRYLAALGLAARLVRRPDSDPPGLAGLVDTLRNRSLTDGQWWHLLRELVKPWRETPDAHPLPSLVELVARGSVTREIEALLGMRKSETVAHGTTGDREGVAAILAVREPALARLLEATDALHGAIRIVVGTQEADEAIALVGATPARGKHRRVAVTALMHPGACYAVDPHGAALVSLEPVMRFAAAGAGEPPELFFLDGRTPRGGARYLALPSAIERAEPTVWEVLEAAFALSHEATAMRVASARPYRGLARFERGDAAVFYGRDEEIQTLANRVRTHGLVTLTGPSGSGKSSLLAAGVIAALATDELPGREHARRGAIAVTVRPGREPVRELAAALEVVDDRPEMILDALAERASDRLLVIVVDQAEELLTLAAPEAATAMADLLARLGGNDGGSVRVVLSVREDFFAALAKLAPLRGLYDRHVMVLGPLDREAMLRALVEPARQFGVRFEAGLAEQMVEDAGDRLPLLQFAADRLWELREDATVLSREAYEAIGGVAGALAAHAEAIFDGLVPAQREGVRQIMLRLVTREGTRATVPRAELAAASPDIESTLVILEGARLLSAHQDADGNAVIELVHEALIAHWPRLGDWRTAEGNGAAHVALVGDAARAWRRRDRARDLLWRGDLLAEHRLWAARATLVLTPEEHAFVAASDAAERRRQRRLVGSTAGAIVGLAAIAVGAVIAWRRATASEVAAVAERSEAEAREVAARRDARDAQVQAIILRARQLATSGHTAEEMALLRVLAADPATRSLAVDEGFVWKAHQRLARVVGRDVAMYGSRVVVLEPDALVTLAADGRELARVPIAKGKRSFDRVPAISPNARYFVEAAACQTGDDGCGVDDGRRLPMVSADGTLVAVPSQRDFTLREVAGREVVKLTAVGPTQLAFAADDSAFAVRRGTQIEVTIGTAAPIAVDAADCPGELAIAPGGSLLAIGCGSTVRAVTLPDRTVRTFSPKGTTDRFVWKPLAVDRDLVRAVASTGTRTGIVDDMVLALWDPHANKHSLADVRATPHRGGVHWRREVGGLVTDEALGLSPGELRTRVSTWGTLTAVAPPALVAANGDTWYQASLRLDGWRLMRGAKAVLADNDLPERPESTPCLPASRSAHAVTLLDGGTRLLIDQLEVPAVVPFGDSYRNSSSSSLPIHAIRPATAAGGRGCVVWELAVQPASRAALDIVRQRVLGEVAGRLVVDRDGAWELVAVDGKTERIAGAFSIDDDGRRAFALDATKQRLTVRELASGRERIVPVTPGSTSTWAGSFSDVIVVNDASGLRAFTDDTTHAPVEFPSGSKVRQGSPLVLVEAENGVQARKLADGSVVARYAGIAFADAVLIPDGSGRILASGDVLDPRGRRVTLERTIHRTHVVGTDASGRFVHDGRDRIWRLEDGKLQPRQGMFSIQSVDGQLWALVDPARPRLVVDVTGTPREIPLLGGIPLAKVREGFAVSRDRKRLVVAYEVAESVADAIVDVATGAPLWIGPTSDQVIAGDWIATARRAIVPEYDILELVGNTGARTNLRVCERDLSVVAVTSPPSASIWAPPETCR